MPSIRALTAKSSATLVAAPVALLVLFAGSLAFFGPRSVALDFFVERPSRAMSETRVQCRDTAGYLEKFAAGIDERVEPPKTAVKVGPHAQQNS